MASKTATIVPKGGLLMGILTEGAGTAPGSATKANLNAWITSIRPAHTWTLDADSIDNELETYFGVGRDTWIILDLKTMKIVDILFNDPDGALAELDMLLSQ